MPFSTRSSRRTRSPGSRSRPWSPPARCTSPARWRPRATPTSRRSSARRSSRSATTAPRRASTASRAAWACRSVRRAPISPRASTRPMRPGSRAPTTLRRWTRSSTRAPVTRVWCSASPVTRPRSWCRSRSRWPTASRSVSPRSARTVW